MAANVGLLTAYADAAGWHPVRSSNLKEVAFAADFAYLFVRFKSGSVYLYKNVEAGVFQGLLSAPSKGKYLHAIIKPNYHDVTRLA
jgi:hypothetical protein